MPPSDDYALYMDAQPTPGLSAAEWWERASAMSADPDRIQGAFQRLVKAGCLTSMLVKLLKELYGRSQGWSVAWVDLPRYAERLTAAASDLRFLAHSQLAAVTSKPRAMLRAAHYLEKQSGKIEQFAQTRKRNPGILRRQATEKLLREVFRATQRRAQLQDVALLIEVATNSRPSVPALKMIASRAGLTPRSQRLRPMKHPPVIAPRPIPPTPKMDMKPRLVKKNPRLIR